GGGEEAFLPELAPALDGVARLAVDVRRVRSDTVARETRGPRNDLALRERKGRHPQRMLPAAAAGRVFATQRHVSTWCSSIMLPNGSCMKICCDSGPTTPRLTQ